MFLFLMLSTLMYGASLRARLVLIPVGIKRLEANIERHFLDISKRLE